MIALEMRKSDQAFGALFGRLVRLDRGIGGGEIGVRRLCPGRLDHVLGPPRPPFGGELAGGKGRSRRQRRRQFQRLQSEVTRTFGIVAARLRALRR